MEVLEGEHDQRPVVMFEFPDMQAIQTFWSSPDYVPIKKEVARRYSHHEHLGFPWCLIG